MSFEVTHNERGKIKNERNEQIQSNHSQYKLQEFNLNNFDVINVLNGKGNKQREIPISDDVSNILDIYINDYSLTTEDYLFSNS